MRRQISTVLVALGSMLWAGLATAAPPSEGPQSSESELTRSVRKELAGLPYYGVFDLLTFKVSDKGVVTLGGYVYHGPLKDDAARVVKKVEGVKEVENQIELLPVSPSDDDIRAGVYRAIYHDSALSRYGTPLDAVAASRPRFLAWGRLFHRFSVFGEPRWTGRPFLGLEPVGEYAIHIIVKNGNVMLAGMVNSQADKDIAGLRANGVFGAFKVVNDLQIAPENQAGM